MKILVLGSTGMLGHVVSFYLSFKKLYKVFNLSRKRSNQENSIICDIKNLDLLEKILEEIKPDIIINCIGILKEEANNNIDNAEFINSYFPNYLVKLSKTINFKVIHISTDCVFSGEVGNYNEKSIKDAKDIYGLTKANGEIDSKNHLTIRTSVIGPDIDSNGVGLFNWIMKQEGNVNGFSNLLWTGVTSLELSKAIDYAINNSINGLWNLTNEKIISKYTLLKLVIEEFNLTKIRLNKSIGVKSDKSLVSIRNIDYKVPDYQYMIHELKDYYSLNKIFYSN